MYMHMHIYIRIYTGYICIHISTDTLIPMVHIHLHLQMQTHSHSHVHLHIHRLPIHIHIDRYIDSDGASEADGVIDWEGKTRAELGGAIAAVELRLAWKNVLARGVAAYTDAGSA